ncbi:MAG: bifunctional YncE family protein/alkaline phosphatase family protein [Myxococcota bacterium]|nr:bifunctional YncE family protein/alkaline phosphatase family protein [Myxococcota bacterium]
MRRGWLVVGAWAWAWGCTGGEGMPLVTEDSGADAADAALDAALDAGFPIDVGPLPEPLPPCDVTVPEALLARPGLQPDGSFLTLDGRRARAAGMRVVLEGFPAQVRLHPTARVAYVVVSGTDDRRLDVIGLDDLTVRQSIEREVFHGLALRSDGSALFVGGGHDGELTRYDVAADGTLTESTSVDLDAYLAGLALSDDGARVYVGSFDESAVLELDADTLVLRRRLPIAPRFGGLWDLVVVPEREQLYASDLGGSGVAVLDLSAGTQLATVPLPVSPAGLVATRDTVFAAVSGADMVAAIDVATRSVVATSEVFDAALVDDGEPLPNGNVNALFHDAASDRLYVSRGADNAISVLTATTLAPLGAIPSDWYPTDVALAADGRTLVIPSGRGEGSRPNEGQSAKAVLRGTVTVVDLLGLDLEAESARASENLRRTVELYRPTCEAFPVPTAAGQVSPIRHVVLIVKENKTFDALLGDLDREGVAADPRFAEWGMPFTPNHHALADEFPFSDNFYVLTPNSDTGHLFLTATHLSEYAERVWLDDNRYGAFPTWPLNERSGPTSGNFFTHLLERDVDLQIYGEIVGSTLETRDGERVAEHSDGRYPGGPFVNYSVEDEAKARYVAQQIARGRFAQFTYVLLPNDHTNGTVPGTPTPESMVADNDCAMGLLIDAISRSPYWPFTAIFVVEDDPQGSEDHVDAHRSILHVVSPWARRGYVSHAQTSWLSVFATIERILGVPPVGRPDAAAAPLYDFFTTTPDFTPYDARERLHPRELNGETTVGADRSREMDFRSPDRNPDLGALVRAYRAWRRGEIDRDEAERRIELAAREALHEDADAAIDEAAIERADGDRDELVDEAAVERAAFDHEWPRYVEWHLERYGVAPAEPPGAPTRIRRHD